MSDLPSDALSYQTVVAEFFLGLRGNGLMLSPLDDELVAEWERRGVPVAVVCRGIRRGLDENGDRRGPGAPRPRSLRALRYAVEDEWHAYRSGRVGDAPAPPSGEAARAAARLEAARAILAEAARAADPAARERYLDAARALQIQSAAGSPLDRVEAALAAADARLLGAWLRSLSRAKKAALGARLRLVAGGRARATAPRAYRDALRAHLHDAARAAGLTCLRGSV